MKVEQMFIVSRMWNNKRNERQILKVLHPAPGDAVLAGPTEEPRKMDVLYNNLQRKMCLGPGEEIRIHSDNGGYLFSVRNGPDGPTIFHSTLFTNLQHEYEQPVALYPWIKKAGIK